MAYQEDRMTHPTLLIVAGLVVALVVDSFLSQVMRYARARG